MFEALGLTHDESALYRLLALRGPCRVTKLAGLLRLPEPRAEAAAEGLVAKSLVTRTDEEPPRLIVSPPDIAGEVLLLRRLQELHTAHAAMGRLASEYRSMPRSPEERLPVEFTPDVAVAQRIEQIQRRARSEVLIFDVPPYVLQYLENRPELEQLAAGVRYRTVYDRRGMELPGGLERIGRYVAAGEEARAAHRLPLKLMVVDRKLGIAPAAGGEAAPAAGSALIHESPLLDGLVDLFERVWADALPLDTVVGSAAPKSSPSGDRPGLGEADVRLLTLLLSGLTDEVIARQLGVGRRTVVRWARGLMDRAGVDTRMQLGWYAARHGWIETADPPARRSVDGP
ncbi:TrmB family transcriptional regulator [Streptomyces sp. NPDC056227]|uniref:TrmB family transcriptional regulator n=1 Tax=Streptomyces sp. NPDC056227 TaxID=3345753 RepID=UPI0035DEAEFB